MELWKDTWVVHNQVRVYNHQRRRFLWIPKTKCLQALDWWAANLILRGKQIVLAAFDATMMEDCINEKKLDYEDVKKEPDIEKPDKFSHSKWVSWEDMVYAYFTATKKSRWIALSYVIHKNPYPSGIVIDMEQEIIKNALLQGNMSSCDTKKVLEILKELTVDTDSETWVKGKWCGREAMLELKNNYDGKFEGERRKQVAKDGPRK